MKKRFTEEQIIGFLREAESGLAVTELCRSHGFSEASYYPWRSKFGGMNVSDAKRLKELENMAQSFKGVEKAFAIQAGRELRVVVEADKISDEQSELMSVELSQRIQNEMQYPGQIKVTVIREKRAVAYAK